MANILELKKVSKSFDNELVLDELDLEIRENTFLTLLGPSGCGKTTTSALSAALSSRTQGWFSLKETISRICLPISGT